MSDHSEAPYPEVPARADFPAIEKRILDRWAAEHTFEESIARRPGRDSGGREFVFYDGPPFANGLPHYGHILTGYVKDVVPRYKTMRGYRVERRFGWDCHGLPAEMETEKELGVSGHSAIEDFGIENFNNACRTSVMKYAADWEWYVTRQARWVDFADDYKTMDLPFMESVMWAFKRLWDQGLVYEDYRVLPYSWAAETPLSNHEIRLDDATRPRQDPAVTVALELEPVAGDPGPMRLLIWTTTPWTLPSNLATAVGPDLDYSVVELDGDFYVIGREALERYEPQLGAGRVVSEIKGRDLVGRRYRPLFPYFADTPNAFVVLGADFVETGEGTGIVHMAPGFGEEDQVTCQKAGIPVVVPVDEKGRFTSEVPDWEGQLVLDTNQSIIRHLKDRGVLVRHDSYTHNYPHCWRTDEPIIYRAMSSWYVRTTELRDRMLELNEEINWIPSHIREGAFGHWLEGVRDWSISRNRFWGAPIPVWRSDDPEHPRIDVYGSLDEIERDFGVRPTDLHRPAIDELVRPNPDDPTGRSMMRRVPEVLDCWFESGSMPFAQLHYPFENSDRFEATHPADFIVEYIAQTRGWFYTLHVLSTALFDRPAFRTAISHGVVLDADGRKLSKRLKNYPDPEEMFETRGSDALRWFLVSSPILRGLDLRIDRSGSSIGEVVRLVLNPIWSAFHFFTLYANIDGYRARRRVAQEASPALIDRYILAKTRVLVEDVTERMDEYDLAGACQEVTTFLDALNNWYIRRSRERFWAPIEQDRGDKADAYDTLYTVLTTLTEITAPLLPLISEEIHTALTGGESVHLGDWPDPSALPADRDLVDLMDTVRDVVSTALSLREERGLRTRLPLRRLTVVGPTSGSLAGLADLIAEEVNVKEVDFAEDLSAYGEFSLKPDGRVLGPRLGPAMKQVMAAARSGQWQRLEDGTISIAGQTLQPGEYELRLVPTGDGAVAALRDHDIVVSLDTEVTPDLAAEGLARDLIRHVQVLRRESGLDVTDRIRLAVTTDPELASAVEDHRPAIAEAVLADEIEVLADGSSPGADLPHVREVEFEGHSAVIGIGVAVDSQVS
ncbi:MAG TPA: isoleucine--tRNA ligase [Acidimicrobiales bacterium]|nr:isoleucine--tRNA ligase [Acidimicrobiales bacterium]